MGLVKLFILKYSQKKKNSVNLGASLKDVYVPTLKWFANTEMVCYNTCHYKSYISEEENSEQFGNCVSYYFLDRTSDSFQYNHFLWKYVELTSMTLFCQGIALPPKK
jgi:hypothetical protein